MAGSERSFVVAVGVDGSEDARTAAEWALREATVHGGRLLVAHAWTLPALAAGLDIVMTASFQDLRRSAEQLLAEEVERLRALDPIPQIDAHLEYGPPMNVLLALAADVSLVVVGSRGLGRVAGLLLGSVSQAVVTRASCPVLVIPPAAGKQS